MILYECPCGRVFGPEGQELILMEELAGDDKPHVI